MSSFPDHCGFDYSSLDDETRRVIQDCTQKIQRCLQNTVEQMILTGQQLQLVKDKLAHGQFQQWLLNEFNMQPRQARLLMQISREFKTVNFAALEIAPSALYLLSRGQTPDEARGEVLHRAKSGEKITLRIAKEIIARHQTAPSIHKADATNNSVKAQTNDSTQKQSFPEIDSLPEHAIVEVAAETILDDSPQDSVIPERIQAQPTYCVGDRVRILRRQMGQDEWCGEIAKVWNIADDGWLRVDVEGHPGVRFTLHPDWVEPIDDITREANMSESTANKASNDPIRVVLPVEIDGQQVNVEGIVTAVDVAYTLNGQSHQINLPADKIVFPR